jgi:hypothetical protein
MPKIVQLLHVPETEDEYDQLFVLYDDGTVWRKVRPAIITTMWHRVKLPAVDTPSINDELIPTGFPPRVMT